MLLCNTLGTRRRSKSNLIHHHTLSMVATFWRRAHENASLSVVTQFQIQVVGKVRSGERKDEIHLGKRRRCPSWHQVLLAFSQIFFVFSYSLHPHKYSLHSHKYSEFRSSTFWCRMFSFGCLKLDNLQISITSIIFQAHLPKGLLEIDWALEWNKYRTVF